MTESGTYVVDTTPATSILTLIVKLTRAGEAAQQREFSATVTGSCVSHRAASSALIGLEMDAHRWLSTLDRGDPAPARVHMGVVTPVRLSWWRRMVFAIAGMRPTVRTGPSRLVGRPVDKSEIGDGSQTHHVQIRVEVDSPLLTDKMVETGATNGSPVTLAEKLVTGVGNEMRERLSNRYFDQDRP
jgi:hypothetical protein